MTEVIASPAVDPAIGIERAGMHVARRERDDLGEVVRDLALSLIVHAPAPNRSLRVEGAEMRLADGDLLHRVERLDPAQLSVLIIAPAVHSALSIERASVHISGNYALDRGQPRRHIALPFIVSSPATKPALGVERAVVIRPRGEGLDALELRRRLGLPARIRPPTEHLIRFGERASVLIADGERPDLRLLNRDRDRELIAMVDAAALDLSVSVHDAHQIGAAPKDVDALGELREVEVREAILSLTAEAILRADRARIFTLRDDSFSVGPFGRHEGLEALISPPTMNIARDIHDARMIAATRDRGGLREIRGDILRALIRRPPAVNLALFIDRACMPAPSA